MKLEEIEKLCDEATAGPWEFRSKDGDESSSEYCGTYSVGPDDVEDYNNWIIDDTKYYNTAPSRIEDAKFIAASRELMPKLLAVAKAAEQHQCPYYGNSDEELLKALQELEKG